MENEPVAMTFDHVTYPASSDRADAWRDSFSLTVDVHYKDGEIENFSGSYCYQSLGSVLFVDRRYTSHSVVRDLKTVSRTGQNNVIFHYILEGGMIGVVGNQDLKVGPGDCFAYDMRGTLRLHMLPGRFIGLITPRKLFDNVMLPTGKLHSFTIPAENARSKFIGAVMTGLADQREKLAVGGGGMFGAALIGLVAATVDKPLAAPHAYQYGSTPWSRRSVETRFASIAEIREYIHRHAAERSFGPENLAMKFGMSRATLYRRFNGGESIAELIKNRRLSLAFEALEQNTVGLSIAAIAQASGFKDVNSLKRAAHELNGETMKRYERASSRGKPARDAGLKAIKALYDAICDQSAGRR